MKVSDALLRHRPDVVREDRAVEEAQERGWDISTRHDGANDVGEKVHSNAGDGRERADGKGSAAAGRNSAVATLPTGEGRDKSLHCDQQEGGRDGGLRGGVHEGVHRGSDEVRGGGADDRH